MQEFNIDHLRIVVVGTGNVATHLGDRIRAVGGAVTQVMGRNSHRVQALAKRWNCNGSLSFATLVVDADLYLVAVTDDAIAEVGEALAAVAPHGLAAHTSGATPGRIWQSYLPRHGVFYPLQTFSPDRRPDWRQVPICVDAAEALDRALLLQLARRMGGTAYEVNDDARAKLHVAAVFVNNFVNHCYYIGEQLCAANDLPFDLLRPLIQETAAKLRQANPASAQTGPARRNDQRTISRHLDYLQAHPNWEALYRQLTASIRATYASLDTLPKK